MCVIQLVFSWLISVVQVNINSSNSPFWGETWKAMTIASGRAMIFQRRGRYPKVEGANLLFWPFPPQKLHKIEKNGPRRRCTSPVPPLGSTNCRKQVFFPLQQLFSNIWVKVCETISSSVLFFSLKTFARGFLHWSSSQILVHFRGDNDHLQLLHPILSWYHLYYSADILLYIFPLSTTRKWSTWQISVMWKMR